MPEPSVRPRRIVVGVSGASGAALGLECLKCLRQAGAESALVVTRGGEITIEQELGMTLDEFACYADAVYDNKNIGAAIASGTYPVDGMIVAPCSMKTLAGIASGYSENLLLRAADVQMKEQRRLVLMVRETPFSAIHIDNMARLARVPGVMLMPPMLTFYNGPATLDDAVHHIAAKALDASSHAHAGDFAHACVDGHGAPCVAGAPCCVARRCIPRTPLPVPAPLPCCRAVPRNCCRAIPPSWQRSASKCCPRARICA